MSYDAKKALSKTAKQSFCFTDREIIKNDKILKDMGLYTKKVCDFKIKVKLEKDQDGIQKVEKNLNEMIISHENLKKIEEVFII